MCRWNIIFLFGTIRHQAQFNLFCHRRRRVTCEKIHTINLKLFFFFSLLVRSSFYCCLALFSFPINFIIHSVVGNEFSFFFFFKYFYERNWIPLWNRWIYLYVCSLVVHGVQYTRFERFIIIILLDCNIRVGIYKTCTYCVYTIGIETRGKKTFLIDQLWKMFY